MPGSLVDEVEICRTDRHVIEAQAEAEPDRLSPGRALSLDVDPLQEGRHPGTGPDKELLITAGRLCDRGQADRRPLRSGSSV